MATMFVAVKVNENSLEPMEIFHGFIPDLGDFFPGQLNRLATFWTIVSNPTTERTEYLAFWVQLNPFSSGKKWRPPGGEIGN
jgi:hypothetical protein